MDGRSDWNFDGGRGAAIGAGISIGIVLGFFASVAFESVALGFDAACGLHSESRSRR